jgi:hypothetical protein
MIFRMNRKKEFLILKIMGSYLKLKELRKEQIMI